MGSKKTGSSAGIHVQEVARIVQGGEVQSIHHATVFQLVFKVMISIIVIIQSVT